MRRNVKIFVKFSNLTQLAVQRKDYEGFRVSYQTYSIDPIYLKAMQ